MLPLNQVSYLIIFCKTCTKITGLKSKKLWRINSSSIFDPTIPAQSFKSKKFPLNLFNNFGGFFHGSPSMNDQFQHNYQNIFIKLERKFVITISHKMW